jgi:hypothetical protein
MAEVPPNDQGNTDHGRMWGQRAIIGALAAVVLIVGGLGYGLGSRSHSHSHSTAKQPVVFGKPMPTTTIPADVPGFLATRPGEVVFFQWNHTGDIYLLGSGQDVALSGQAPNLAIKSKSLFISGALNDGGKSVSIAVGGVEEEQFGRFNGANLMINFPEQNGVVPVTFVSASVSDFDTAVSNLWAQAAQNNKP